jgi:hypothetical protein
MKLVETLKMIDELGAPGQAGVIIAGGFTDFELGKVNSTVARKLYIWRFIDADTVAGGRLENPRLTDKGRELLRERTGS